MKVSPIAEYLRINKAIPKHDKYGCHFISQEGLYLGRLTKSVINNYKVITLETFGEGLKKMYTKSVAYGQQYAYVKNDSSPIGLSLLPVKTYMRKVFADFIERKSYVRDTEKTLSNKLNLIAVDENSGVGIYDTEKPFKYRTEVTLTKNNDITKNLNIHPIN